MSLFIKICLEVNTMESNETVQETTEQQTTQTKNSTSSTEQTTVAAASGNTNAKPKTNTGLEENIAGLLCYVFTIFTGLLFLFLEKENRFIKFHALQSIFLFVALVVFNLVMTIIPILGWIVNILMVPVGFAIYVFLMYKAYKGEMFKLPFLGDLAEKQVNPALTEAE